MLGSGRDTSGLSWLQLTTTREVVPQRPQQAAGSAAATTHAPPRPPRRPATSRRRPATTRAATSAPRAHVRYPHARLSSAKNFVPARAPLADRAATSLLRPSCPSRGDTPRRAPLLRRRRAAELLPRVERRGGRPHPPPTRRLSSAMMSIAARVVSRRPCVSIYDAHCHRRRGAWEDALTGRLLVSGTDEVDPTTGARTTTALNAGRYVLLDALWPRLLDGAHVL